MADFCVSLPERLESLLTLSFCNLRTQHLPLSAYRFLIDCTGVLTERRPRSRSVTQNSTFKHS